ncbi:hypothetical protein D3C84_312170 [compost metagenome]
MYAIQVDRQLAKGLLQQANGFLTMAHAASQQGDGKLFHFLGEQGRAVELDHLQTAVNLMDARKACIQRLRRLRVIEQVFNRVMSLFQRFGNLALDPLEGHIVVPITHNHSNHNSDTHGRFKLCPQPAPWHPAR